MPRTKKTHSGGGTAGSSELLHEGFRTVGILLGALIYAAAVNLFLQPLLLYSGGFLGIAQLIQRCLENFAGMDFGNFNLSGILYYILNIPGLIWAFFKMRRRFVIKTIVAVTFITVLMTVIPIPAEPILEEKLANCIVSGLLSGLGGGIILRMGASDGGIDIISMVLIQTRGNFSVGRIGLTVNCCIFALCLVLFDAATAIYSMIYAVTCSIMFDRVHTQNINVQALIVTKLEESGPLEQEIMLQMNRGLTRWTAYGGYTGQEGAVLMTIISKYEESQLRSIVREFDPDAFVMLKEGVHVDGHFLKKLT